MRRDQDNSDIESPRPSHWRNMREHRFFGATCHFQPLFPSFGYRNFRSHRDLSTARDFPHYLGQLVVMPLSALGRMIATARIRKGVYPYHVVFLQPHHDSSFRSCSSFVSLKAIQVDGSGFVFIPYADRIKAAGNSPEAVHRIITEKRADKTPDSQVQVTRFAGDGSTVTMFGAERSQGACSIERRTETLAALLARSGGVSIEPEISLVTVTRGAHQGKIWFEDLYGRPRNDIALRDGDTLFVTEAPFTSWDKTVAALTGTCSSATTLSSLARG